MYPLGYMYPSLGTPVLHYKHMTVFKSFTSHVIAWSVSKGFHQSIRRRKEQKTRLQCLASAMPKPVMPSGAMKSASFEQEKAQGSGSVSQKAVTESLFLAKFQAATLKQWR